MLQVRALLGAFDSEVAVNTGLRGQAVKTSPFHGGNTGSIPVGVTSGKRSFLITASRDYFLICPNEDVMSLDFFDLLMHLPFMANQFRAKAYGHIPRISVLSMRAIMFPTPGLDVQKDLARRFLRTVKSPDELMRNIKEQRRCAMEFVEKELFYGVK